MEQLKHCDNMISSTFIHTNEILFNRKIPLDKYCIKIIMYKYKDNKYTKEMTKISELAKEKNINLKFIDISLIDKKKPLDYFINSIESD